MYHDDEHKENIEKLGKMIKSIDFAMMTTNDDGILRSRPMSTQDTEFDGTLWFFTHGSSHKVGEIAMDRQVNLSYAMPSKNHYVSVSGTAELVIDKSKMKELWKPAYKAWFPGGLEDPDLALLKVTVEQAEYWDMPSSTMVHLFGYVKALATGEEYKPGKNEKITL